MARITFEIADEDVTLLREIKRLRQNRGLDLMNSMNLPPSPAHRPDEELAQVQALALMIDPRRCAELELLVAEGVYSAQHREQGWYEILKARLDDLRWDVYQTALAAIHCDECQLEN